MSTATPSILRNLAATLSGNRLLSIPQLGLPGWRIPVSGLAYSFLGAGNADDTVRVVITTQPSAGSLRVAEDTTYVFDSAPEGVYWFEWQLYINGIAVGDIQRKWLGFGLGASLHVTLEGLTFQLTSWPFIPSVLTVTLEGITTNLNVKPRVAAQFVTLLEGIAVSHTAKVFPLTWFDITLDHEITGLKTKQANYWKKDAADDDSVWTLQLPF